MMTLTQWNPNKELEGLQTRLSSLFARSPIRANGEKETIRVAEWAPLVDIVEDDTEYRIIADMPEVRKEDIKISAQDDVLTISGERETEKGEKIKKFHRVERVYGRFERSFLLPGDADPRQINAELKEGILRIHIPKSKKPESRAIEVKVG